METRRQQPHNSTFKAVLFDLDGTLVEFKFKVKESREAMIELLASKGFDIDRFAGLPSSQALFNEVQRQIDESERLSSSYTFARVREELSELLNGFERIALSEARPHPGSLGTVKRIMERGVTTAIVTNSGRGPVESLLSAFGFLPYLSLVITRDEAGKLKPEPDGILVALARLGVGPGDAVYVGDSVLDIQASRRAGVQCVSVATGLYRAETLMAERPDFLISRIEELEEILFPPTS